MLPFKLTLLLLLSTLLFSYPTISSDIKEKRIYPMGEKIYSKKCPNLEFKKYTSYKKLSDAIA